jgi:hypothetical protein
MRVKKLYFLFIEQIVKLVLQLMGPFKELSRYLLHSVRHVFGTTRSVFERVGLPAVQGKCTTDLYVT